MVYCFAELRNYRQLTRLRAATLPGIESGIADIFQPRKMTCSTVGQGAWLIELGDEEDFDSGGSATALLKLVDLLDSNRQELFGYSLLVAPADPGPTARVAERMRDLLLEVEGPEGLWISPACSALFSDYLTLLPDGSLSRVSGPAREPEPGIPAEEAPRPWVREALVNRALDVASERMNTGESSVILHLHGPPGVGTTTLLREMARRLLGGGRELHVFRTFSLFKRRSPLHPFLNSLSAAFLPSVPRHLIGVERAAWEDVGGLLSWLLRAEDGEEDRPHPDHVMEDFIIGYRLCITAWLRMAVARGLPALFICEGIDAYHPDARRIAVRVISSFLHSPDFVPIISTVAPSVPEELGGLEVRSLFLHPLGRREMRSLSAHLYPGLALPETLIHQLTRRSGGIYLSVLSYLQYLQKAGRIRFNPGSREWAYHPAQDSTLPANPLSASWYLLRSLPEDSFLVLYAVHLAGGLLDRRAFITFLSEADIDQRSAERALSAIAAAGLVVEEESLIPRFPVLRRKLEESLGVKGIALRDRFLASMYAQWEAGKYPHTVLLFTFFARNGRTDLALRVLPELVRRKLDEGDVSGARTFLEMERLEFSAAPTRAQRAELESLAAFGTLRAALLKEDREAAEAARRSVTAITRSDLAGDVRGEAHMELTKHSLATGDTASALEEVKRAMILYQEPRDAETGAGGGGAVVGTTGTAAGAGADAEPAVVSAARARRLDVGERASYLWLGVTMLADGKLSEAVEYVSLSERLCREEGDEQGALLAGTYLGVCHFMEGRYTQCRAIVEQSVSTARALCRREAELFLLFLKARMLFQIGAYEECATVLQSCLCLAEIYAVRVAVPVLRAWLGRVTLHKGEMESGIRLLKELAPTREVLFFLAEGFLFAEELENASPCLDQALAAEEAYAFPFPETTSWAHGFASVEGRCFRLSRGDAFLRRSLSALRACLLGLRGHSDEAIPELHKLTRSERSVVEDPNGYWYNYLYSMVLPESGTHEFDDKETVLGKALKSLQELASRIDAPAERSAFLNANTWNRRIMGEARARKLV